MPGILYVVATPIGNLQDMTFRAVETLREVDLIACEDTRHTIKLLNHFGIKKKLVSYHEHNESARANELRDLLSEGKSVAVVSDAGTPAICDPSFRVVEQAIAIGARVVPIPGAVAFVSALVASGLPTDSFFFGGFLPSKRSDRVKRLRDLREIGATLVFYESPHRIAKSLADAIEILGNRRAVVAREITKIHENFARGSLSELAAHFAGQPTKGEIVIVIDRADDVVAHDSGATGDADLKRRLDELESAGTDRKTALKKLAKEFGLTRSEVYRRMMIG